MSDKLKMIVGMEGKLVYLDLTSCVIYLMTRPVIEYEA